MSTLKGTPLRGRTLGHTQRAHSRQAGELLT